MNTHPHNSLYTTQPQLEKDLEEAATRGGQEVEVWEKLSELPMNRAGGKSSVILFKKGIIIKKVPHNEALTTLINEIKKMI